MAYTCWCLLEKYFVFNSVCLVCAFAEMYKIDDFFYDFLKGFALKMGKLYFFCMTFKKT